MKAVATLLLIGLTLSIAGCSDGPFTPREVDRIAKRCAAEPNSIKFNRGHVVIFEPVNGDPVSKCVFDEFNRLGKSFSTVGNARYEGS